LAQALLFVEGGDDEGGVHDSGATVYHGKKPMSEETPPPAPAPRHALWSAVGWLRDLFLSVVLAIVLILFL
jgi:hypothetical protein